MVKMNKIIDLTPNYGVSLFIKNGLFNAATKEGFDFVVCSNPIISSKASMKRLLKLYDVTVVLDFLKMCAFALKILPAFFLKTEQFISYLLHQRLEGVVVGDCILSAYQRNLQTKIIISKNIELFLFIMISCLKILTNFRQTRKNTETQSDTRYLIYCFETTGTEEAIRRFCIRRGAAELRYSGHHKGFRLYSGYDGIALKKNENLNLLARIELKKSDLEKAKTRLCSFVERTSQYDYLKSVDVDMKVRLDFDEVSPKSSVVLFLATVSDAQYLYGVGPFPTLDLFHEAMIKFFLSKNYYVIVKPHPAMLKNKDYAAKDRKYYEILLNRWKVNIENTHLMRSRVNNKLLFVSERLSVKELSRTFSEFLCITQHGSVAAECAYLGHLSLVAENSQFSTADKFVEILQNFSQLSLKLDRWKNFEAFSDLEEASIYEYICIHHFYNHPLYQSGYFYGLVPEDIDSSEIEVWVNNFIHEKDDAINILNRITTQNIMQLKNNFSDWILHTGA